MKQTVEAPNGAGWIRIEGSAKTYKLETSFAPFGIHRFLEELEKRLHVKKVEKDPKKNTGIFCVKMEPENFPYYKDMTVSEIVTEAAEESKVFEV